MTVYCHNCGAPNTDEATACARCGAELQSDAAEAPKPKRFKGTMMMPGVGGAEESPTPEGAEAPPAGADAPAAPEPSAEARDPNAPAPPRRSPKGTMMMPGMGGGGAPPPGAPPPGAPAGADAPEATPDAPPTPSARDLAFQETMMGPAHPPVAVPAPPTFGEAPTEEGLPQPAGAGSPPSSGAGAWSPPPPRPRSDEPRPPQAPPPSAWGTPASSAGAPPAGAPPSSGGGFGAQPSGRGAGPGFGAPAGGPAGFGGPGATTGTAAPTSGNRTWIFLGVGCLAIVLVGAGLGAWIGCMLVGEDSAETGGLAGQASQLQVAGTLTALQVACSEDPNGAAVAAYLHPGVDGLAAAACGLGPETVAAVTDPSQAKAERLSDTADARIASDLGLDPARCIRVTVEASGATITTCTTEAGPKLVELSGVPTP